MDIAAAEPESETVSVRAASRAPPVLIGLAGETGYRSDIA
jgi:hypothetical protein